MDLTKIIMLITFGVVIATFILTFLLWYHERKIQLNLLRSLYQHIESIRVEAPKQYDFLINTNKIPSWTTTNLDINYYLSHIMHKLKKEGFTLEEICTRELKEQIIKIVNRINTINNLYSLMYAGVSQGTKAANEMVENHKIELSEKTYYVDLEKDIYKAQCELRKVLKKGIYANKTYF